jgi:hypothetical protein
MGSSSDEEEVSLFSKFFKPNVSPRMKHSEETIDENLLDDMERTAGSALD